PSTYLLLRRPLQLSVFYLNTVYFFPLILILSLLFFFFNDPATTEIYTLSLHDALPICRRDTRVQFGGVPRNHVPACPGGQSDDGDRKSTRLNSSHVSISYAVFCLKKKKKKTKNYSNITK